MTVLVSWFTLKVDGDFVAVAVVDVAVHAVNSDVQRATDEPLGEWRIAAGPGSVTTRCPIETPRLLVPERKAIGGCLLVYSDSCAFACDANSSLGGNLRFSCSRFDKLSSRWVASLTMLISSCWCCTSKRSRATRLGRGMSGFAS